jgi:hypothetical protein
VSAPTDRTPTATPPPSPHASPTSSPIDKLAGAVAENLCRHRSVGLFRLTLDLTWRRLDLFAEIGAVEVDKGVVAPPTSGTDAWWAAVAAVREAVYLIRGRSLAQYVGDDWAGPPCH